MGSTSCALACATSCALACATLAALLGAGCASRPAQRLDTPTDVVRAQCAAIIAGDELAAAALLTPEARRRAPLWPAPGDVPDASGVVEAGRLARWDGERPLELVRVASGWQIRSGVLGLARADTPERALEAFARGILARDWELVAGLLPADARRQAGPAHVARWIGEGARGERWRRLALALGDRRFRLDESRGQIEAHVAGLEPAAPTVVLAREPDGWKVFDVRPRVEYTGP